MPPRKPVTKKAKPSTKPKRQTKAAAEGIVAAEVREARGRPSEYTEALAKEICKRIANGETLRQVCRSHHVPPESTVRQWVLDDREGFSAHYARARDLCLESWADEVVEICDDATNDWMKREHGEDKNATWVVNGEHVTRSRLRIDSRKWLLSKLKPERYGDRVEHTGAGGGAIQHQVGVSWMTEDQAKARGWA